MSEAISPEAEEDVVTVYDQLIEEGRQKGLAEGRVEGRAEGRAELLLEALAAKFGRLPAAVRARFRGASDAELRVWLKTMLTARTLEAVFTAPGRGRAARPAAKAQASRKKVSAR